MSINTKIMQMILKKINNDRIPAEIAYNTIKNKKLDFKNNEIFLTSNLKIEFENPEFWYFLGQISYQNYEFDKFNITFLENALYCFNVPFEKNKTLGKTIICDSFQNPKELFSLSYSEYLDFLNRSLDYLIVLYDASCYYEGFSLPNIHPKKPELIERFEVIIRADYNQFMENKEQLFTQQLKKYETEKEIIKLLKNYKKIKISELVEKLKLPHKYIEEIIKDLIFNKNIDGSFEDDLINIKKIKELQEKASISLSDKGQCAICYNNIEKESVFCSNCDSKFHILCFLNWITTNQSCPVCQKILDWSYVLNE